MGHRDMLLSQMVLSLTACVGLTNTRPVLSLMPTSQYMGMYTCFVDALRDVAYYVQRTERNSAFFLAHRELVNAKTKERKRSAPAIR